MVGGGAVRALRRRARRRLRGLPARAPPARRLLRSQRDRDRAGRPAKRPHGGARRSGHGARSTDVERGAGRVDLVPGREGRRAMAQDEESARPPPGTSRRTGARATRYELLDRFECGIELLGTEVKALREGKAQIGDAYAVIEGGEVWLRGAHIPPYGPASIENHEPERERKLLLHRYEIERLIGRSQRRGLDPDPDPDLLQGPARQGRAGPGARQGAPRSPARASRPRPPARGRARASPSPPVSDQTSCRAQRFMRAGSQTDERSTGVKP